jgi:sugar (pentulose or hexulose) kinase
MEANPVIAIFDVGKTNKKLFLFDQDYQVIYEKSARFTEITDESGDPCENLESLQSSITDSLHEILSRNDISLRAVNFSAYGASFVYLDSDRNVLTPLYNYLKAFPPGLLRKFYDQYGGEKFFSQQTASPVLGSLNSGMQLYRIKNERPELFNRIHTALHLPQYLSYLVNGVCASDLTSIGCHTNLWDFDRNAYHQWVTEEGIIEKLAPVLPSDKVFPASFEGHSFITGIGLHDSSAALIPYLVSFQEPFLLISTGTWCISMNPFNHTPLTESELQADCLNYMTFKGKPLKSSRLFAGHQYDEGVKRIADHYNTSPGKYRNVTFNENIVHQLKKRNAPQVGSVLFDMNGFASDEEAYHQLMIEIIRQQYHSSLLVLNDKSVKRIFVDGGFSKNTVYMNLLANVFPELEIYAASMSQATAVGTAMAIHSSWNSNPFPNNIIELKYYAAIQGLTVY